MKPGPRALPEGYALIWVAPDGDGFRGLLQEDCWYECESRIGLASSADGATWTFDDEPSEDADNYPTDYVAVGDVHLLVGDEGIAREVDGEWEEVDAPGTASGYPYFSIITGGDAGFVAFHETVGNLAVSKDGVTWKMLDAPRLPSTTPTN